MTVVEAVLVLAVIPAAIYALITLMVMWPRLARPRYRAGQDWNFSPVLWVADPVEVSRAVPVDTDTGAAGGTRPDTARGGARGNW
ncbi:aa3-type cytochrome oxidase subunit CtaJ [Salinifilum ghardaiensis]